MRRCVAQGAILGLMTGCGPSSVALFLGFPPTGAAESLIVAFEGEGQTEAFGVDLEARDGAVFRSYPPGSFVEAVALGPSLSDLGLRQGAISLPGAGWTIPERHVSASFRADVNVETGESSWTEVPIAASVMQTELDRKDPGCHEVIPRAEDFVLNGLLRFMFALSGDEALVGTTDTSELQVVGNGVQRIVDGPYVWRAVSLGGRRIMYSDAFRLFTATVSEEAEIVDIEVFSPMHPLSGIIRELATDGTNVLIVVADGRAAHFDGAAWNEIPALPVSEDTPIRITWTANGGYYWVRGRQEYNRVLPSGDVQSSQLDNGTGLHMVKDLGPIGVIGGTDRGSFVRFEGAGLTNLGGEYGWWVLDAAPWIDGFAFVLASGSVGEYLSQGDLCDQPILGIVNDARVLVMDDYVLVAGYEGETATRVKFLDL